MIPNTIPIKLKPYVAIRRPTAGAAAIAATIVPTVATDPIIEQVRLNTLVKPLPALPRKWWE